MAKKALLRVGIIGAGFMGKTHICKYPDSVSNFPGPRFPIGAYIQKLSNGIYEGNAHTNSIR